MPKDQKEIIGSVRIGKTVFVAGQEDELAAVLSANDVERLTARGVISGFSAKAGKAVEAAPAEAPTAEEQDSEKPKTGKKS